MTKTGFYLSILAEIRRFKAGNQTAEFVWSMIRTLRETPDHEWSTNTHSPDLSL